MSENESNHHGKHEIIIIKRHGGGHEGAHGGAWKIAYADFMTAMMAFFLIMWLVNAANEETKAAVASYFNPIKLTDPKPAQRGLKKPAEEAEGETTQEKSKDKGEEKSKGSSADEGKDKAAQAGEETQFSDADYFENPYAVLAEIAKESNTQANVSPKGDGGAQDAGPATGAEGGEAYRDPFDPDFWTQQVEVSATTVKDPDAVPIEGAGLPDDGTATEQTGNKSDQNGNAKEGDLKPGDQKEGELKSGDGLTDMNGISDQIGNAVEDGDKPAEGQDNKDAGKKGDPATQVDPGKSDKDKDGTSDKDKAGKTDKDKDGTSDKDKNGKSEKDKDGKDKEGMTEAEKKLAALKKAAQALEAKLLQDVGKASAEFDLGLEVEATEGGLLISVSDQVKSPMFDVGSAVPRRDTVIAMKKIAEALKDQAGEIVIRGHTDGRKYKKGTYDNWRLSTDRAQSAYYMLINGGLPEKRVSEVSGFADRDLKIPGQPLDDQNRRIEILIRPDAG